MNINNHSLSAKISATGDVSFPYYIGYPLGGNKRNITSSNVVFAQKLIQHRLKPQNSRNLSKCWQTTGTCSNTSTITTYFSFSF